MRAQMLTHRVPALALIALAACTSPTPVIEPCEGLLVVTVQFDEPAPTALRVVWEGEVVHDSCDEIDRLLYGLDVDGSTLTVRQGDVHYVSPETLTLHVYDQGDCTSERLLFSAVEVPVGPAEECSLATLELSLDDVACCCESPAGDVLEEELRPARACADGGGRCVAVDAGEQCGAGA